MPEWLGGCRRRSWGRRGLRMGDCREGEAAQGGDDAPDRVDRFRGYHALRDKSAASKLQDAADKRLHLRAAEQHEDSAQVHGLLLKLAERGRSRLRRVESHWFSMGCPRRGRSLARRAGRVRVTNTPSVAVDTKKPGARAGLGFSHIGNGGAPKQTCLGSPMRSVGPNQKLFQ
jgi:hypothetical protein